MLINVIVKFVHSCGETFVCSRIVVGREVSIAEAKNIKKKVGIEIEMFIHGSMCISHSGNCVISNYTAGRDSNRGGCAHSCRFKYKFQNNQEAYFMSSKDLNGINHLLEFSASNINSLKISLNCR